MYKKTWIGTFKKILCAWLRTPMYGFCLDPPEIELETNKVHSGENKEAHLTCIVKGNPPPKVNRRNRGKNF